MSRLEHGARVVEYTVAVLLTMGIVALHYSVLCHAGPLWRDEISTVSLAAKPTFSEFWSSLNYDPIPALLFLVVRTWQWFGFGGTDFGLRLLGFLVGLAVLTAVWIASWLLKKAPPSWALLIFGLSPVAFVWGDSLRAYGLGCFFNILSIAFVWRLIAAYPRPRHIIIAGCLAVLSVHSLFPNAILLFAAGMSAIAVAAWRGWWRGAVAISGVGIAAAASLLIYVPIIRQTQRWSAICNVGVDFGWIWTMASRAISSGGWMFPAAWLILAMSAVIIVLAAIVRPSVFPAARDRDLVLYLGGTFLLALLGVGCFFRVAGWTTSLWYYLPLMGTGAVCLDSIFKVLRRYAIVAGASSLLVLAGAAAAAPLLSQAASVRLTNIDLAASAIERQAQPEDLIVVDNFFYSVSFNRYYHGKAECVFAPGIADLSLHRWDLLKERMTEPHAIQPILERVDRTLQSGHTVFVVGFAPSNHVAAPPADLPPAPSSPARWSANAYIGRWAYQIAYEVQTHSTRGAVIPLRCDQPVSEAERVRAFLVCGWKDPNLAVRQ